MLEVLQFIFSSFWTWFGTVILIWVTGASIGAAFGGFKTDEVSVETEKPPETSETLD